MRHTHISAEYGLYATVVGHTADYVLVNVNTRLEVPENWQFGKPTVLTNDEWNEFQRLED